MYLAPSRMLLNFLCAKYQKWTCDFMQDAAMEAEWHVYTKILLYHPGPGGKGSQLTPANSGSRSCHEYCQLHV